MKNIIISTAFLFLLFIFPAFAAQDSNVIISNINNRLSIYVTKQKDSTNAWYIMDKSNGKSLIGYDFSMFNSIFQMTVSPDEKYLAILSAGEGHPVVEILDLQKLLKNKEYKKLAELNPYPGYISIKKWQKNKLIIESDAMLTEKASKKSILNKSATFVLSMSTLKIKKAP